MHFCAVESDRAGETLIGTADCWSETLVLIECPLPWKPDALCSKAIPLELQQLHEEITQTDRPIRLLLIHRERSEADSQYHLLIYQRPAGLSQGYIGQEILVSSLTEVPPLLRRLLDGIPLDSQPPTARDLLVCTHGTHDKCCTKYGLPFYQQAKKIVSQTANQQPSIAARQTIRLWQSSHFGGHRFAPTLIDLPEARCYGRLNDSTFQALLARTGDIQTLRSIYRGASLLCPPAQVLELELILQQGWDWFNYKLYSKLLEQTEDESYSLVELWVEKLDGSQQRYRAEVVEDIEKAVYITGECGGTETYKMPYYTVKNYSVIALDPSECDHGAQQCENF